MYDADYSSTDVVGLVDAIAPVWKKPAVDCGLDTGRLYTALERVIGTWRKVGASKQVDKDLQALLALSLATAGWFTADQLKEMQTWLDEVASAEEENWMPKFPEEEVREVLLKALKAREVTEVTYDEIAKTIVAEYLAGNYGAGKHNGRLEITDEGLKLYDLREPGKYLLYGGDHPSCPDELRRCLKSQKWDIYYDEEENIGGTDWSEEGGGAGWSAEGDGAGWSEARW